MARMRNRPAGKPARGPAIIVRRSPAGRSRAIAVVGGRPMAAAIGRSGITSNKREGDGATPRGRMHLEYGLIRRDRLIPPASRLPLVPIRSDMGWCDAPRHPLYNRLVCLPFAASHETLMRKDGLYDVCLVLDWNRTRRRRHGGSAIFLHIARPGYSPTEGCIAVSPTAMRYILAHARAGAAVIVP